MSFLSQGRKDYENGNFAAAEDNLKAAAGILSQAHPPPAGKIKEVNELRLKANKQQAAAELGESKRLQTSGDLNQAIARAQNAETLFRGFGGTNEEIQQARAVQTQSQHQLLAVKKTVNQAANPEAPPTVEPEDPPELPNDQTPKGRRVGYHGLVKPHQVIAADPVKTRPRRAFQPPPSTHTQPKQDELPEGQRNGPPGYYSPRS